MNRRLFCVVALAFAFAGAPAAVHAAQPTKPVAKVTGIKINNINFVNSQLVANTTVTLNIAGRTVEQVVAVPLKVLGTVAGSNGTCDILRLSLGPIRLELLGLVVNLDDCKGGPVIVEITGDPEGGLLGQLLCGIAGLLDGGLDLNLLDDVQLGTLTSGLTDLLNQLLGKVLAMAGPAPAKGMAKGECSILNLEIPKGIHLELLGLNVDTSGICLSITAQQGPGKLLGNLLCSLTDLLTNKGNNGKAELVLVRNINRLLDQLGL